MATITMRKLRIAVQTLFFILFAGTLFYLCRQPLGYVVDSSWFLRLNPLVGLLTFVAAHGIVTRLLILSGAVLVLTVILGRFFCGFVCPLGSVIDFSDRFLTAKMRSRDRRPPLYLQRTKYVVLIALAVLALFGIVAPVFMDPISLLTRISTLVLYPMMLVTGSDIHGLMTPLFYKLGMESLALSPIQTRLFYGTFEAAALLALIVGAGFWDRRFYCQYVCPSGAFFGLLSRFPLYRRKTLDSCGNCLRCARSCPTRAINDKDVSRTSTAECVLCGACTSVRANCNVFSFFRSPTSRVVAVDAKRRHVMAGVLGGLALLPGFRANALTRRDLDGRLIRPPGAIPEREFLSRCIACNACTRACPTGAIQPSSFNDGLHRLFTPKITPRIGGCEEKCYLCGHVCPTEAIRPLTYETKRFAKIGTAVIDRHRCLPWEQNKECVVCDEVCPYNAIVPRVVETTTGLFKVPVVVEDLCVGCGFCEHHCPITDKPAIVVFKFGENRRSSGPYVSEFQAKDMEQRRRQSDNLSVAGPQDEASQRTPAPATPADTAKPKGGGELPYEAPSGGSQGFF